MLTNCQSQATKEHNSKLQDAKDNFEKAKNKLHASQQDTITTFQKFIQESEKQIKVYEKNIAELKLKISKETGEEKAKYEKKLAELDQKNKQLKTKITNYKDEQIDNWDEKQIAFRKDLDELGNAIAGFFDGD